MVSLIKTIEKEYKGKSVTIYSSSGECVSGVVAEVGEDFVRLTRPFIVWVFTDSDSECPYKYDELATDIFVSASIIEKVFQPKWCALREKPGYVSKPGMHTNRPVPN